MLRTGAITNADMQRIPVQIAQLLLRSLADEEHPIQRELAQLLDFTNAVRSECSNATGGSGLNVQAGEPAPRCQSTPENLPTSLAGTPPCDSIVATESRQCDGTAARESERPAAQESGDTRSQGRAEKPIRPFRAERVLFMPQPGISSAQARKFWILQLLLQTSARSAEHTVKLAEHLKLTPAELGTFATDGAKFSVDLWTRRQWLEMLDQAIEMLDYPDPPLPFRLDVRNVVGHNGNSFRLSQQEAVFVQLLIDHLNKDVSYDHFQAAGIKAPVKVKGDIAKKFRSADIEFPVTSNGGAYILGESTS